MYPMEFHYACRDELLRKWQGACAQEGRFLSLAESLKGVPEDKHALCKEVYSFLQSHGAINFGAALPALPAEGE